MSEVTNPYAINVYEENLNDGKIEDYSNQKLDNVPVVINKNLCVLYLQHNNIRCLPDDFFPSLPNLMWLDLRNNNLTDIPVTIQCHLSLTHLLLQNNNITALPNELGTVPNLKMLQLQGNPLMYPPREIINSGLNKILVYLHQKHIESMFNQSDIISEDTLSSNQDIEKQKANEKNTKEINKTALSILLSEKEQEESDEEKCYAKLKGKCPRLARSRMGKVRDVNKKNTLCSKEKCIEKLRQIHLKEVTLKKHRELLASREKIIQGRKNSELLKNWRKTYRNHQIMQTSDGQYKLEPQQIPYDTSPEYMTILSREDIEKDLPDKYKKKLIKKSKPTVPRKNTSDVHLAMKIKQLFDNLESINLNRTELTPRTEQKLLLNEIQKISEIKQKLMELSLTNMKCVES